jgi:hypothetical protein
MKVKLLRATRLAVNQDLHENEHVRLLVNGRVESAKDETATVLVADWELCPSCRCGNRI